MTKSTWKKYSEKLFVGTRPGYSSEENEFWPSVANAKTSCSCRNDGMMEKDQVGCAGEKTGPPATEVC